MTYFENRSAASALRSKALQPALALVAAASLWGAAMAARAGDPPPQQLAADAPSGAAAPSESAKPDPQDRVICKLEESLGSHLDKRVCHTKREWRQIEADDDDQMFRGRDPSITARGSQGLQPH